MSIEMVTAAQAVTTSVLPVERLHANDYNPKPHDRRGAQ
jgi:hypothetical protein